VGPSTERAQIRKHRRRAARASKGSEQKTAEYAKVAKLKAHEADRRKDWCEKTSTVPASTCDIVRFEKLNIRNMTARAKPKADPDQPGAYLKNDRAGCPAAGRYGTGPHSSSDSGEYLPGGAMSCLSFPHAGILSAPGPETSGHRTLG
jgi:transposase